MMNKVLFTHSYYYKMDEKQWKNQTPFPPLATLYAASFLRNKNYDVSLFDVGLKNNPSEIIPALINTNPDFLVIYDDGFNYLTKMCLTKMRDACFEMIRIGKNHGCTVIISSSDATDHAEKYLKNGADFIIFGEAEQTLLALINTLKKNNDPQRIDGIIFENNNIVQKNKSQKLIKDLDMLPIPAWDLVNIDDYKNIWEKSGKEFTLNIATTRGCPFHCNWCAKPIYGQRYNSHSPKRVVELIAFLSKKYGVKRFWMCDDIFGLKPNWVQNFNHELKKNELKISYYIQTRADLLLKDDTIDALSESGLEEAWIGAESGSQKILNAMDKGITIAQIETSTLLLKSKNIRIAFFIQFGYLGETKEDINKTISLIKRLKPDNIGISVSYPLPSTPFYEKVKHEFTTKENWTDSDDLAMMFKGTFNQNYYRKLQRYVHKEFRKTKGFQNLITLLLNPFKIEKTKIRSVLLLLYYVPSSIFDRLLLNKMENNKLNVD